MASFGRLHRATAIVPLAVLSAAWTASLAGVGVGSASADPDGSRTLPGRHRPPGRRHRGARASIGDPVTRAAALTPGSASSIPQAALSAYQRAEGVINKADPGCNLPWELIAAIGRVESDHGRFGGNALDDDGVARPGIYGIALNGKNDTQAIADTDGGQYDDDTRCDRAVGPMQFIPSTWSVVGVDGDSDGTRNPQDVDDAALATAVYLCSGDDDLSQREGPARRGLPLQPLQRLRRPGAVDHAGLPRRRLQRRADLHATSGVIMPDTTASPGPRRRQGRQGRQARRRATRAATSRPRP